MNKKMNKKIILLVFMGILGFFGFKSKNIENAIEKSTNDNMSKNGSISYEEQIEIFRSLGYIFANGVTKELILTDGYAKSMWEEIKKERLYEIEQNPFSLLYFYYGWRSTEVQGYNFSNKCIWFDLEFIDSSDQYIWFMERMGKITHGEITYSDINIRVDSDNYEWIDFAVNGISKSWKLAKLGYIDDSFFQRFLYLTSELKTKGKYTYFDDGGQQFVIDYATEEEQKKFIKKTGLKREWLGQENHFSEHLSK